jgi:hypothetical protein
MPDIPLPFPFLDVAMRVVAVLILCVLPVVLMPLPQARRGKALSPSD